MAKNDASRKRFPFSRARGLVFAALVAFVAAGLAFHIGAGTPSAFGIDAIAAVCPLGALEAMLGAREVMFHPLVLLIAMVAIVVLVGKAFCAWACPVPWLRRLLRPEQKRAKEADGKNAGEGSREREAGSTAKAEDACATTTCDAGASEGDSSTATRPSSCGSSASCTACSLAPVGGARDGFRFDARHATLVGALGATAVFGFPVFCLVCPIGLAFATFIGLWHLLQFNETSWGLVLFPAILVLEVVFLRKWCTKICPVSALLSLLSNANRTLRPRVDRTACLRESGVDCHVCVDACPERVDPHSARIPECSKCGACAEACPAQAIKIKLLPKS